jgi:hypothetical protein
VNSIKQKTRVFCQIGVQKFQLRTEGIFIKKISGKNLYSLLDRRKFYRRNVQKLGDRRNFSTKSGQKELYRKSEQEISQANSSQKANIES